MGGYGEVLRPLVEWAAWTAFKRGGKGRLNYASECINGKQEASLTAIHSRGERTVQLRSIEK